jgi:plastocyanin
MSVDMSAVTKWIFTQQRFSTSMSFAKNALLNLKPPILFLVVLLTFTGLITTACSGNWFGSDLFGGGWFGGSAEADQAALLANVTMLTVDMYDSYYGTSDTNMTEPPIWTIPAGSDVVVNLINHGAYDHNWAIVKKGITVPVPYEEGQAGDIIMHGIGMVYNNSQTTITFSAPDLGEYQVICTVSGHYPLMQGKLLVTESGQVASE